MTESTASSVDPKVCLIVGAGDGTGSAVARRFAQAGYTVCVTRRTPEANQGLLAAIHESGGRALAFSARCAPRG